MFLVSCRCGETFTVRASSAGVASECRKCGRKLEVPSLSTLQSYTDKGVPAPCLGSSDASPGTTNTVPETKLQKFFIQYCGEVSPTGRVSTCAMNNYLGVLQQRVDAFLESFKFPQGFELLVSCALLPQSKKIVQVETAPAAAAQAWAKDLETLIRETVAPPIHEGPVAFLLYHRLAQNCGALASLVPFSELSDEIKLLGADVVFMKAAGFTQPMPVAANSKPSLWQRLRCFIGGSAAAAAVRTVDSPQERHEKVKVWFQHVDSYFANQSLSEVKKAVLQEPEDFACHIGLAVKLAEAEDWKNAITAYTKAMLIKPDDAHLFGRRGHIHQLAGNCQAALADFNQAIELAPFEHRYYAQRGHIYAAIGAWPQVEQNLTTAHELAPREPTHLLYRATSRVEQGLLEKASEDFYQTLLLDPYSGNAHGNLSWIYHQSQCYDASRVIEHASRAIELMPDDVGSRIRRSLVYAAENKLALALEDCDILIQAHPELASAHGARGRVLQLEGEFDEAIAACTRAIDLGLEAALVFLARGISYASTNRAELAVADCETALALEPNNALACQLRGTLSMQNGELDSALQAFRKASELAPEWTEPRAHLAWLYRLKDDPQSAVDEQSILVSQQPKNAAHYVNRAYAYAQLHDYEKAKCDLDLACQLDPANEQGFYVRGQFWMQRQEYDLALHDFNRVLSMTDDHDNARLHRAIALVYLKRPAEALDDCAKLIVKHPADPHAYAWRAYALQVIGNETAAAADFSRVREIVPEYADQTTVQSLSAKAAGLQAREEYHRAIEIADEIIALAPDMAVGYRIRASQHWDLEQFVEAYDDYTRVLEFEPYKPEVLSARGQVQAEMGEWQQALDDLDRAIELSRTAGLHMTLAYSLSGRALALAGLGRFGDSTRDYEESVVLCPTNPWVYYYRGMVMYQRGECLDAKCLLELATQLLVPPLSSRKKQRAQTVLKKFTALSKVARTSAE